MMCGRHESAIAKESNVLISRISLGVSPLALIGIAKSDLCQRSLDLIQAWAVVQDP